ncbi:unnamed protein product [Prorocentrum cordatum]|uniref:Integrase catalytic domain-containing protein n=1 Tax=Prorocentrum cordatum TaxID=2364126 RepID=A0ABN9UUB3_9DINO|nr:unnamed protein product [Polarella glacialis]
MFKILKNSGASLQVLKMVKNFKSHACGSSVLPKAVRTAAGIEIPEVFEVMGSDGLERTDPVDDTSYLLTLNIDEGSGLTQVTNHGDKSQRSGNRSAADVLETWRSWTNHYRVPRLVRCDAEGCHRAELTKSWCSSRGIEMFIASGEAHWLMGKVERRIQLFKRTLTKFRKQNHDCDIDEAISYVIHAINDLDKARPSDRLSEADQSTLRTWCGALSWLGVNTLPWVSAWVADVQSKIPTGDYKLLGIANNITKMVKANKTDGFQIFRHSLPGCGPGAPDFRIVTWCDAAWASRPDGHSQGGHVTALSTSEGPFHQACDFTVLDLGSRKLKRVARSSLSAEIQEASDAEGEQMMVRLVLYEVLYGRFDLHDRHGALHRVPGALVTDCKAFYDGVVKSKSAGLGLDERRTAIEALALRRALEEGGTLVRWVVHSHAQLADGMTKASLQAFHVLHASLKNQRWKIVHDERFLSARKRSALGKGIFDETT